MNIYYIAHMKTHHTATFITDRGHIWEIDYTMEGREVTSVTGLSIDGKAYTIRTQVRESKVLDAVATKVDLIEWACDDLAERDTHHMIDD